MPVGAGRVGGLACVESLENRRLLSASAALTLSGSYSGTVKAPADTHFPISSSTRSKFRTLTLSTTQDAQGGLTGTASIVGLGNFSVTGYVRGRHFRAILSGDGSGEISGTISSGAVTISGKFFDRVQGSSLSGTFTAATNASATTGNATLNFVAGKSTGPKVPVSFFASSSVDGIKFTTRAAAIRSKLRARSNLTIAVTSENKDGLLVGTVTIGSLSAVPFRGISRGRIVDVVFTSSTVSGEIVGKPSGSQLASGSISANISGSVVGGTFHSQSVANGVP